MSPRRDALGLAAEAARLPSEPFELHVRQSRAAASGDRQQCETGTHPRATVVVVAARTFARPAERSSHVEAAAAGIWGAPRGRLRTRAAHAAGFRGQPRAHDGTEFLESAREPEWVKAQPRRLGIAFEQARELVTDPRLAEACAIEVACRRCGSGIREGARRFLIEKGFEV